MKPDVPLKVETDASDVAVVAILNQDGLASGLLLPNPHLNEQHHSSVEKEAHEIVEASRKWRYFSLGTHFELITDLKSVAFIYDTIQRGKVKNEKVQRWKRELSCFRYKTVCRPSIESSGPDCLSRTNCAASTSSIDLKRIHDTLSNLGVTRMFHSVQSKKLPFPDVKTMTSNCKICAELKQVSTSLHNLNL